MGRGLGRFGRLGCVIAIVFGVNVGSGTSPAHASTDLREASHSMFTVDPAGVVHVQVDITITNTTVSNGLSVYYFDAIHFSTIANALDIQASIQGAKARIDVVARNRFYSDATIHLNSNLLPRQTQVLHVQYDIPRSGARVPGVNRVNPAYMSFVVFSYADPGMASVTVRVPTGYNVDVAWETMESTVGNGYTDYTATAIANPGSWTAAITANNEAALHVEHLTVQKHNVDVRSWPDDPAWRRFVRRELRNGIPALERLVGSALPKDETLQITETSNPYIYGYGGWYKRTDNTISVGDALDPVVLLHETSHEWFNGSKFVERWLSEGFAQEFSTRAVTVAGKSRQEPTKPVKASAGRVTLNDWSNPNFSGGRDPDLQERYGYNAAFYVMRSISSEIGADKMRAVAQAALGQHEAYGVRQKLDEHNGTYDWQVMLDLFQRVGGSQQAESLFRKYVIGADGLAELDLRATSLGQLAKLETSASGWATPKTIRRDFENWSFRSSTPSFAKARAVLDARDLTTAKLATLGVKLPTTLQPRYENGNDADLEAIVKEINTIDAAAQTVIDTTKFVRREGSPWQRIGMIGADTDKPLADAVTALKQNKPAIAVARAEVASKRVTASGSIGRWRAGRLGGALLLLLLVLWCCHLVFQERRREVQLHQR